MKKVFHLLTLLFLSFTVFAQDEYLARLSISGSVSQLGISPNEEVWVATRAGNVYYTKQFGELWHIGPFGSFDPYNSNSGNTFERINFFSQDTVMISGFIQDDGKENFVYWSNDHCKTWQKVEFGKSSWLDAAYINNNGKAWMSGSSQLIYFTADRGKTWATFNKVEATGNLRFTTIFFLKDEKTGLFGSTWNVIYKTADNCKSWEKIPTPLDQKKYQRISKEERPEIEKIRIFGNYYIVKQQGRIFITKSNLLNWVYRPDIIDFEVDEDGNLYTVDNNLSIGLYDSNLTKLWTSEQKLKNVPIAIGVKNNKLFALTSQYLYKINSNDFKCSQLFTNDTNIPEPYLKVNFEGKQYGFENRDILCFDNIKQQWFRLLSVDFSISNATLFQGKLIISDRSLNNYYNVIPNNRTIIEFKLPESLFTDKTVTEIHFENGSRGCFDASNLRRSYYKKTNSFIVDQKLSTAKYLSQSAKEIEESTVQSMIKIIDKSRFSKLTLADLNISENDVKGFKTFIDNQEQQIRRSGINRFSDDNLYSFPGENTNFNFYKSVADTLSRISEKNINNAFWEAYGNWSTTTNWRRVIFVFKDGKKLIVENSDDKPNYLYTPWLVDYEGLKFKSNSMAFGQYVYKITDGYFFSNGAGDKNYAIFKIADYLYRKDLKNK
jgi:hypothetical protein